MKKFFLILLLAVLVLIGFSLYILARTGLVELPLLTDFFYQEQEPIRIVQPISNYDIEQDFNQQIEQYIYQHPHQEKLDLSIQLPEAGLTDLIEPTFKNSLINQPQIAVEPEYLEFYAKIVDGRSSLLIQLLPEFDNSNLKLTFHKIKLGNLSIPLYFGNFVANQFIKNQLEKNLRVIIANTEKASIELSEKSVILDFITDRSNVIKQ